MFLFSLFIFLSLLFLTNHRREKQSCHESCKNEMYKYHYSISNFKLLLSIRGMSDFDGIVLKYNFMALAINCDGILGGPSIIYSMLISKQKKYLAYHFANYSLSWFLRSWLYVCVYLGIQNGTIYYKIMWLRCLLTYFIGNLFYYLSLIWINKKLNSI